MSSLRNRLEKTASVYPFELSNEAKSEIVKALNDAFIAELQKRPEWNTLSEEEKAKFDKWYRNYHSERSFADYNDWLFYPIYDIINNIAVSGTDNAGDIDFENFRDDLDSGY